MQQRSTVTRTRILDAARDLFLARSFAEVTIDQVAAAADTTKGGVYYHFESKEDLYMAMLLRDLEEKKELFRQAVEMEGSCRQRLHRLTLDYFRLPRGKREAITLLRRDVNLFTGEARTRLVRAYQRALPGQVEAILCAGIDAGEIAPCDARLLSWSFVALVEVSLSPHAGRIFPGVEAKLEHVMQLFFEGAAQEAAQSKGRKAS